MTRTVRSILDLSVDEVDAVLARAAELRNGAPSAVERAVLGSVFLAESLRTRAGFTAAAARLGMRVIDVVEVRSHATMSASESIPDTLRTVAGMCDVLVARSSEPLLDLSSCAGPSTLAMVSAGDGGPDREHPSQCLIDLAAISDEWGPLGDAHVVVCGDLAMRSVRSLLKHLSRVPPRRLTLVGAPGREHHGVGLGAELAARTTIAGPDALAEADVLYLPGLPAFDAVRGDLDDAERARFAFGATAAKVLPASAVVLSPMPVIDEIAPAQRSDPRVRLFGPSDASVSVRAALLELLLRPNGG